VPTSRLLGVLAVAMAVAGCGADDDPAPAPRTEARTQTEPPAEPQRRAEPRRRAEPQRRLARSRGGPRVRTVATGLEVPWEIAFLPDGRALITERPGRIRLLSAGGQLRRRPVATVDVSALGEGGLLGLALDPDFEDNRFVYLYFTTGSGMVVERRRFARGRLRREATLVRGIRAGPIHDSGRIAFGPDGRLYIASGDAGQPSLAQDRSSLNGKFLTLTARQYRGRGGRPRVLSLGHRNPQGFDWQPGSGRLYASEHGDTGNDEVNLIRSGRNYGWPDQQGEDHGSATGPVALYPETIAPSGAAFVSLPGSAWSGDLLVAALAGEQIRRVRPGRRRPRLDRALFAGRYGRLRTVVEAPDGSLYALTSNRDGRGSPREGDDRVLRIVPPTG